MSAISRLVLANWPLKLTALGLAVVLYMGVAISESTRSWAGPIPIEVLNAPPGGALLDDPGTIERIEYRAPDEVVETLTHDSFRASIDLSAVAKGFAAGAARDGAPGVLRNSSGVMVAQPSR